MSIFPLDNIRVEQHNNNDKKIFDLIKKRYLKYGVLNFYNGLFPVLLRSYPATTIGMLYRIFYSLKKEGTFSFWSKGI